MLSMDFTRITEQDSRYNSLENMSIGEFLTAMNQEDQTVPLAVAKLIPALEVFVAELAKRMEDGGRLFYIGAGTSGRLGVVDASECPPTFGVPSDWVNGIIAGGDAAIRQAVEGAEDDTAQAWVDLQAQQITAKDTVIGIAASGTTPYVIGGIKHCNANGILTAGISCNPGSPLATLAQHPLTAVVGPEIVTGSSRLKAGTAQKLILNMISTATMIQLGRIKGNKMVDMQLSNAKLVDRGVRMLQAELSIDYQQAKELLLQLGSVRNVLNHLNGK